MNGRVRLSLVRVAVPAAAAVLLGAAPAADARDVVVRSFDGTPIAASFFPAQGLGPGQRAPTILETHGWGLQRDRDPESTTQEAFGQVGLGPLRRAGYNVLTWDSRGFGESGGTVSVDSKDFEGRDVSALLDWLATQPEALLDGPGDPRAGMHGASYAGGIELVAAAIDPRIDAIAPDIAWHSLLTALYRDEIVKAGWGLGLAGLGLPSATLEGLISPAGPQTGSLDPHITSALASGLATGTLSAEDRAWFASRGPGDLVRRISAPTLLVQGTADTLFTPSEAIRNFEILRGDGVPVKMVWFCGGHGVCLSGAGPSGKVEHAVIVWMDRWLKGDPTVSTGPRFEWLADDARWRAAADWPLAPGPPLVAEGRGTLAFSPADSQSSGLLVAATPSPDAVDVPVPAVTRHVDVVGEPRLELTYSGTAAAPAGHLFAQIVDAGRNLVLGNQATPIAVTLDGAEHTVTRSLEGVAAALEPSSSYRLQIVGGTSNYGLVRSAGTVDLRRIRLTLPTGDPGATPDRDAAGVLGTSAGCLSRRVITITLRAPHGGRLRSARVTYAGRRAHIARGRRWRARIDLRGTRQRAVRVRVVARTRSGRTLRETRTYRTCAARRRR
jgi:ABC-2 type transport system ATP-binding protein